MRKTICDRCGSIVEYKRFLATMKSIRLEDWSNGNGREYDLCGNCFRDVKRYIERKAREERTEGDNGQPE